MSDGGYNALMAAVRKGAPGAPVMLDLARVPQELTGIAMGMGYRDGAGRVTRRWVTIRSIDVVDNTLWAYCWKRRDLRSFRLDRIRDVVDGVGEVRDGQAFLTSIGYGDTAPTASGGPAPSGFARWSAEQNRPADDAQPASQRDLLVGGLVVAAVIGALLWLVL